MLTLVSVMVAVCVPAGAVSAAPQMPTYWSHVNSPNVVVSTAGINGRHGGANPTDIHRPSAPFGTQGINRRPGEGGTNRPYSGIPPANALNGVAAISPNDVWAVGSYNQGGSVVGSTLIEHWNGKVWAVVPSPSVGTADDTFLSDVTAVSANDVWAAGTFRDTTAAVVLYQTLVEHWNGTTWSVVASPNANGTTDDNTLASIAAISANDVWAVGSHSDANTGLSETLIEHWNGTAWSIVSSPNVAGTGISSSLYGVAAVSGSDVWAVGQSYDSSTSTVTIQTLAEHWNGTTWSIVSSSNLGGTGDYNALVAVAALATDNVWAVGYYDAQTLAEHWNGTTWSVVPTPSASSGTASSSLAGVVAVAANDVWAVGDAYDYDSGYGPTFIEHWNGSAWSMVRAPSPGMGDNGLYAITAVSATNIWAVGYYYYTGYIATLTEHYGYLIASPSRSVTPATMGRSVR